MADLEVSKGGFARIRKGDIRKLPFPCRFPKMKSREWVYRLAANLALAEGLIIAFLALFLVVNAFFSEVGVLSAWIAEIVFATLGSIGLITASKGLRKRKSWGRAPVVLANLIAIPVAYYLMTSGRILLGVILGIIAIPALVSTWLAIPEGS